MAYNTWQLLIHRKMLNLKRCQRRCAGESSPMVKYGQFRRLKLLRRLDADVSRIDTASITRTSRAMARLPQLSVRQIEFLQERGKSRVLVQALQKGVHFRLD